MILESLEVDAAELERRTGWAIKPEGACKGDRCVPLADPSNPLDARTVSEKLRMPLVTDEKHGLWAIGPEADAPPLGSALAPNFTLPDWKGEEISLDGLRGNKVLLLAWASW